MSNYQLSKTGAEIDAALDLAITHEITKANVDGNYPDLTAGDAVHSTYADFASQIETDREIDDAEEACPPVVFGTVGGNAEVQSGLMKFPELRGHTIKWNQLADCSNNTFDHEANTISSKLFNYHFAHKYLAIFDYEIESSVGNIYFLFGVWNSSQTSYRRQRINATGLKGRAAVIVNFDNISATDLTDGEKAKVIIQHLGTDISASNKVSTSNIQFFDLTDNIYGAGNEPTSADVFVRDFPLPYYEYNAGTLLSSKSATLLSIGRNQWDEEWEVGTINDTTGENETASNRIRSKNYIPVLSGAVYFANCGGDYNLYPYFYDAQGNFLSVQSGVKNNTFTIPSNAVFMRFIMQNTYGTTYNNDICIYINWDTPNLPYVKYQQQRVELPNIELRSARKAYDVAYQEDGGKRRIGEGDLSALVWHSLTVSGHLIFYANNTSQKAYTTNIVCDKYASGDFDISAMPDKSITGDGGAGTSLWIRDDSFASLSDFQAAISGTVYFELATETDITTTENPGWDDEYLLVDNFGTLIFGAGSSQVPQVPQSYFIRYTVNPVEFLDSVGEKAGWDADEIALKSDIVIPEAPTTDGTYTLKVTVSNGTPTYSWIAD